MNDSKDSENIDIGTQMVPVFKYELSEYWEPDVDDELMLITPEQNSHLFELIGDFKSLSNISIDLANTIKSLYEKETTLIADIDTYTRRMIKTGRFTFTKSKDTGELLPTIRDGKNIVKQVRLKELNMSPQLAQSISNLQTHAAIAMVMKEVELLNLSISRINKIMWNELIGESKGAWQLLMQALEIPSIEDRNASIRNALQIATVNRAKFEENFNTELQYVLEHANKKKIQFVTDFDGIRHVDEKAENLLHIFAVITNDTRVEVAGNIIMNQQQAAIKSIKQYQSFVKKNQLDSDGVLYLINECCNNDRQNTVEQFNRIRDGLEKNKKLLECEPQQLLEDYPSIVVKDNDVVAVKDSESNCKHCGRPLSSLTEYKKCYHCRSSLMRKTQNIGGTALGLLLAAGTVASQMNSDSTEENDEEK